MATESPTAMRRNEVASLLIEKILAIQVLFAVISAAYGAKLS
ncbi:hypothetical protein CPTD_01193 [Corynebacterium pseudotuberculosis]|nr:hypothetical protein CPTB_02167 [Corynebacterium pseudotuberculosis]AKC73790.1 Hypothetical protein Cp226_1066 [Corynebacterium pseudotuberculosis]ATQ65364.1 Hypothetical protein CpPA07_1060 [Corynebacterium pseudotuberculosis]KEX87554.1 hypothetical protein CPTD_01193 [Corynebacterium pseudotuberculosis]